MSVSSFEDYGRYCSKHRLKYSVGYTIGEKCNPCVLVNGDSVFCEVDAYTTRAEEKVVHIAMALNAWDEG